MSLFRVRVLYLRPINEFSFIFIQTGQVLSAHFTLFILEKCAFRRIWIDAPIFFFWTLPSIFLILNFHPVQKVQVLKNLSNLKILVSLSFWKSFWRNWPQFHNCMCNFFPRICRILVICLHLKSSNTHPS